MAITAISRDWGIDPQIVRVVTTDTLATIIASGYLTAQDANINALMNGDFEWKSDDYILISYSGGESFFTRNSTLNTFVATGVMSTRVVLTAAQILAMSVTPVNILPVAPSGLAYVLSRIWCVLTYGSAQFANGGVVGLEWAATAALAGPAASSTLAAATFNGYAASNCFDLTPDGTDTLANIGGKGVWISNATAPFITGDSTLAVNVNYNVVQVS